MVKRVSIGELSISFRCDGGFPRFYRKEFSRDFFADLSLFDGKDQGKQIEAIENISYAMAKYATPGIDGIDDWLAQFDTFELVKSAGTILEMLSAEQKTTVAPKKKSEK